MFNENYVFPNKPSKSSNIYEDIDIPLENRDYDVLQNEKIAKLSHKDTQIEVENNISNNNISNNVDDPTILTKQNPKNNFKNLFIRMTNTRKKLIIFICAIVLILLLLIVILVIIILAASI